MNFNMELAVLTGDKSRKSLDEASVPKTVEYFLDGKFDGVLSGDVAKQVFAENKYLDYPTLEASISKNVEQYTSGAAGDDQTSRELELLVLGASCLQVFVQNNWTGPPTLTHPSAYLPSPSTVSSAHKSLQQNALAYLCEDGEPAYHLCAYAPYLHVARIIFLDCRHVFKSLQTWQWWLARCLMVQQQLLEQKSPTLKTTIMDALEQIGKKEWLIQDDNRDAAVLFHMEAAQACQYYWDTRMAHDHVTQATKLAGISVELTGALGKRTRFQHKFTAQLVVRVTRSEEQCPLTPVGLCDPQYSAPMPTNVPLDDDTVMEKIQFQDEDASLTTQLSPLEQVLLYVVVESHRRALAQERLTNEEVVTYLEHILSQASNWAVSSSALALRSRLQIDRGRTVNRSMSQLQELFNQTKRYEVPSAERLQLFYAALPPSVWAVKSQLAALLISLGIYGKALELYEGMKMWENVIDCYIMMKKQDKAQSVIRELLQKKETPTLLCLLGDVTGDQTHYHKAWELSHQRSARAMRCLGYINFREEKYDEAVKCFEKSLEINCLQVSVWFTCGCTSLVSKNYESAVKAFKRCVNIDYDNYEAWNNLATAYARLGKKHMAFLTMKDSIKCSFENWRLWENCLSFATDSGEFEEAINAYGRLLDLKDKFTDTEVLGILVGAVVGNMKDTGGRPAGRLLHKLTLLFGRLAAKMTLDAKSWKLYADLCLVDTPNHPADQEKAAGFLQKAHRCLTQEDNWERLPEGCERVAHHALELNKVYKTCVEQTKDSQKAVELLTKAKFSLKGVVTAIRQKHTDPATQELAEPMSSICDTMDQELQTVTDKLQQLQTS